MGLSSIILAATLLQPGRERDPAQRSWTQELLFIGDREAGQAAANLLTIITTCKNAVDDPYAYLLDVMRRMPLLKNTEIASLIPERWIAGEACPAAE